MHDDRFVLALDFGTGAFANIRRYVDYDRLDAVVISHMHADHFIDLIPLRYALCYGPLRRAGRMPLYLPPGGKQVIKTIASAFAPEGNGDFLDAVFAVHEYDPSGDLTLGAGTLRFAETTHYIPTYAIRYESGGTSVTYSSDTAPDARVTELARGTDLFLCEATNLHGDHDDSGFRGHSTAAEAAHMATDAEVKRLILTHYSDQATPVDLGEAARDIFTRQIDVADDHDEFTID